MRRGPVASRRGSVALCVALVVSALAGVAASAAEPPRQPPGLEQSRSAELQQRLTSALAALPPEHEPRTRHLRDDGSPIYTNRLLLAESPYLRQHAHNPVEWYPWGEEAFELARERDVPVFLSVGYSTCHWCHVMEEESFDDEEVAARLNRDYVAVKVDREQHPDVDEVYMTAVQLATQRGGWPMTVLLTPDRKPFFGGTYLPKENFLDLLDRARTAWDERREAVMESAIRLDEMVRQVTGSRGAAGELGGSVLDEAVVELLADVDLEHGGIGGAPKFPREPALLFLLERLGQPDSPRRAEIHQALVKTLDAMARGGIYDQIGGGFHRYTVDVAWRIPHFEKMLYNQAQLARVYTRAYALWGDPEHRRIAVETLEWVLREMTSEQGAFYSATDADSFRVEEAGEGELEEGAFFVWTPGELREALEPEEALFAASAFGVEDDGNLDGRSVLHLPRAPSVLAADAGVSLDAMDQRLDELRARLREVRSRRPPPLRDDKVVTAWNGMMITALAEASTVFHRDDLLAAAVRAADQLWSTARRDDGSLWRLQLEGSPSTRGLLEDYAYLAEGLLALDRASGGRSRWLDRARQLAEPMVERFWDDVDGGFFVGHPPETSLLTTRPKSPSDGAIASGNSVATKVLVALAARTGEPALRRRAEATLEAFSAGIARRPSGFPYMLTALSMLLDGEAGPVEWGASGAVRAEAQWRDDGVVVVMLDIADGWHVNGDRPLDDDLIATSLQAGPGWRLDDVRYPPAERVALGFRDGELAVFQGRARISGRVTEDRQHDTQRADQIGPLPLRLRIQACDDQLCLQPEDLVLELPTRAP